MHVEAYSVHPDECLREMEFTEQLGPHTKAAEILLEKLGDTAEFSDEAVRLFRDSAFKKMQNGAYSLKSIDNRIATVRGEIASIWNSALPDDEKYKQISSLENEISLLQAGQFNLVRNGFTGVV